MMSSFTMSPSMMSHYDRLGIPSDATPAQLKAAYHGKLREFPAHSHPEEFKAIRAAYDAIRKGETESRDEDFLKVRPIEATIAPELIQGLKLKAISELDLSIEDLIRETF
ncbi:J domain-containing protein [Leptolyngbya sp. AN03gr2]|uniref:J domain-containing protein n=1 Tax=unclassified Leptolyngbya TaxID=2650499 RepID=UPI003D31EFA3